MSWTWWNVVGVVVGVLWITGGLVVALARWILRGIARTFFGPWFLLALSCAHGESYEAPPELADAGDPCDACWEECGRKDNFRDVVFCSHRCNFLCVAGDP